MTALVERRKAILALMNKQRAFDFLVAAAVVSICAFAWLARYAHPMGDDWSYAHMGMTHDLLPWLKDQYLTWNGRYFSNILVGNGPLSLGLDHLWLYRSVPVVLIMLTLIAAFILVRVLTRGALTARQQWVGAVLFTALFLHGMPDLAEGFYWYTGAVTYQFGNVLLLLQLASFAAFLQGRYLIARTPHLLMNLLLAILVVGGNEVHMILLVAFHAMILFLHWRCGERPSPAEWLAITVVLLSATVMFLAPGNAVRASYFDDKHQFLHSVWWSILQTGRFGLTWISDPSLLIVSILYLPLSRRLSERVTIFQRSFHLKPLWSSLMLGAVIFLCVFPAYWNTGILGQHRTVNVAYCFFLPLWFINLTVWCDHFPGVLHREPGVKWIPLSLMAILALHLLFGRNGGRVLDDLASGTASRFDRQLMARYADLDRARSTQGPIQLAPITAVPKALYLFDIADDPRFWTNRAYGIYFRLEGRPIMLSRQLSP